MIPPINVELPSWYGQLVSTADILLTFSTLLKRTPKIKVDVFTISA